MTKKGIKTVRFRHRVSHGPIGGMTEKESTMTELQLNFIRRACHEYGVTILEELFGVPDELSDIPDWARTEINDLVEMLRSEDG